jgi:hypothetical protein
MYVDPVTGQMQNSIMKTSYTHEAMVDIILANPAIDQNDLARHFGYSASWVSTVISSDSFQAYLAARKEEIIDPVLRGAVEESFKGLVMRSIDILRKKLDANPSDDLVMEVFKNSSRALGYGARVQIDARVQHSHSLIGVLAGVPSKERVVSQEPAALSQSA